MFHKKVQIANLFFYSILIFLFSAQLPASMTNAKIYFADSLYIHLDKNGFKTNGVKIFGSFKLKNEEAKRLDRGHVLQFPEHEIILAHKDYTIYILDLNREKMLGKFKIPSRGAPKYIDIIPEENGYASVNTKFRILPEPPKYEIIKKVIGHDKNGTEIIQTLKQPVIQKNFRPGPLIEVKQIYVNGKYVHDKQ